MVHKKKFTEREEMLFDAVEDAQDDLEEVGRRIRSAEEKLDDMDYKLEKNWNDAHDL
jgi:hypothetical protein